MKTIKLENNDLPIENGDFSFADDDMEQSLYIIFSSGKGEWFFNPNLGINLQNILGKVSDQTLRNEIVQGISQESQIELLDELNIQRNKDRTADIQFKGIANGEPISGEVEI